MVPLDLARPVLVLEASTSVGSVALLLPDGAQAIEVPMGAGAADGLFPAVMALLETNGIGARGIAGVVCGAGPGGFTSLRIAASLAKGLAHGAAVPLYALPSLALAAAALSGDGPTGPLLVHADALRGERYALMVHRAPGGQVAWSEAPARRSIDDLRATGLPLVSVGPSPEGLRSPWTVWPRAGAVLLVEGTWRERPVEIGAWEPLYGRLAEAQVKWEASNGRPLPDLRNA